MSDKLFTEVGELSSELRRVVFKASFFSEVGRGSLRIEANLFKRLGDLFLEVGELSSEVG